MVFLQLDLLVTFVPGANKGFWPAFLVRTAKLISSSLLPTRLTWAGVHGDESRKLLLDELRGVTSGVGVGRAEQRKGEGHFLHARQLQHPRQLREKLRTRLEGLWKQERMCRFSSNVGRGNVPVEP